MNCETLVIFSQERVFSHSSSRKRLVVASRVTQRSALLPLLLPPLSGLSDDVVFNKKWPLTGDHHKAQSLSKYRVAENLLCFNAFIYGMLFSPFSHFSSQTVLCVHTAKSWESTQRWVFYWKVHFVRELILDPRMLRLWDCRSPSQSSQSGSLIKLGKQ